MKIRYFPDTDTLYIELADRVSSSSEAVSDNLIVDLDEQANWRTQANEGLAVYPDCKGATMNRWLELC